MQNIMALVARVWRFNTVCCMWPLLTERENYAEKGESPFWHMFREWAVGPC